jgi:hypothetical protein
MDLSARKWTWDLERGTSEVCIGQEEVSKYKLDPVVVQEVRWDGGGTEPAGQYTFFYV